MLLLLLFAGFLSKGASLLAIKYSKSEKLKSVLYKIHHKIRYEVAIDTFFVAYLNLIASLFLQF